MGYRNFKYQGGVLPLNPTSGVVTIPTPTLITSFPVGDMTGQRPFVHVRDITNGFDLYELNPDTISQYPASCTKLMTGLLAREYHSSDWTSTVTVTAADVGQPLAGITVDLMGLATGDVISWENLAYGMFLPSGCDACLAVARIIGTELFVAAGNTGTTGVARFVERMNARAAELGMTNTNYTDPFGGGKTFDPEVIRNTISARDLTTICKQAMSHSALRTVASAATRDVSITGGRTTTISLTGYNRFNNGPTLNQSGITDTRCKGGKNGTWITGPFTSYSLSQVWQSPAGHELVITTLGSVSMRGLMLDQRGLMYQLLRDFPYLSAPVGSDASWSNVKLLIGADTTIVDESAVPKTVAVNSVTVGNPVNATAGGMLFNALTDTIRVADDADFLIGAGDFTAEFWFSGNGTSPPGEFVFISKADHLTNQKEYIINLYNGLMQFFLSTDGSNWNYQTALDLAGLNQPTYCNGAPRHMALVKSGDTLTMYMDGEKSTTSLTGTPFNGTADVCLGYYAGGGGVSPLGSFDDFRITMGVARYTANMVTLDSRKLPRA